MISKNIAERPLNVTSVPNIFKSFIKEVYEKEWTQNIKKKKIFKIITSEQKSAKKRGNYLDVK